MSRTHINCPTTLNTLPRKDFYEVLPNLLPTFVLQDYLPNNICAPKKGSYHFLNETFFLLRVFLFPAISPDDVSTYLEKLHLIIILSIRFWLLSFRFTLQSSSYPRQQTLKSKFFQLLNKIAVLPQGVYFCFFQIQLNRCIGNYCRQMLRQKRRLFPQLQFFNNTFRQTFYVFRFTSYVLIDFLESTGGLQK